MDFLEKDLEQIVWENDDEILQRKGLPIFGKRYRQLRIGNYGIADLVTFYREHYVKQINFTVYELKKDVINMSTLIQAYTYVKGIETYLSKRGWACAYDVVLIGKSIDRSSGFCYLPDLIENLTCFSYHMDINGLHFKSEDNYNLTNTGFKYEKKVLHSPFG